MFIKRQIEKVFNLSKQFLSMSIFLKSFLYIPTKPINVTNNSKYLSYFVTNVILLVMLYCASILDIRSFSYSIFAFLH